jgi:hypothetical protein
MWVNIQRIIGVAHCANVVWPDLAYAEEGGEVTAEIRREMLARGVLSEVPSPPSFLSQLSISSA